MNSVHTHRICTDSTQDRYTGIYVTDSSGKILRTANSGDWLTDYKECFRWSRSKTFRGPDCIVLSDCLMDYIRLHPAGSEPVKKMIRTKWPAGKGPVPVPMKRTRGIFPVKRGGRTKKPKEIDDIVDMEYLDF